MEPPDAAEASQVRNSVFYLGSALIANGIPVGALVVLSRLLTKEEFGYYALAQIYATFAAGVANFGLLLGYERNFFEYRDRKASAALLYSTLTFVLAGLTVILGLTWTFQEPLARLVVRSHDQARLLFWTAVATGATSLKGYYLTYFRNSENAKAYAGWTVSHALLEAMLALFFVGYVGTGVLGLAYGEAVAAGVVCVVLALRFLQILPLAYDAGILADSLRLSAPLTPRIFFGILSTQADKYLLALLSSVGGVGVYSIGQRISFTAFQYMTAIQNIYAPRVYRQMFSLQEAGGTTIGRYLTKFAYASIAVPMLLVLFSEELVLMLTPRPYHGAAPVALILSLYYAALFFGKVGGAQLIFARRTFLTTLLTLVSIGLNLGLSLLLIPLWGPVGASWATTLAGILAGAVGVAASQRSYRIVWEARKLTLIFGWLAISGLGLLVASGVGLPYLARLPLKLAAAAGYGMIGIRLQLIPSIAHLRVQLSTRSRPSSP